MTMRLVPIAAVVAVALMSMDRVAAQSWQPPPASARCPSKWGANDERGAANLMTPETVLRAARLIRSGEVIELGRVLSADIPLVAGRRFDLFTKRTNGPLGTNKRYSNEEVVVTELGQIGTQFDMFAHQAIDGAFYNCIAIGDVATRNGFTKLGVQNIGALFTRGVLVDVAGSKSLDMLPATHQISVADIETALTREHVSLQPGDAVLFHTGWGRLWGVDNAKYATSSPGIGAAAAEWLAKHDVMLLGADTGPVEILPNPDKTIDLPVHQIALVVNGIFLLENLKLDQLAEKHVYEFALVVQPLKIRGGTGSTVAPIAVR
jgi:kynurenine formamidase